MGLKVQTLITSKKRSKVVWSVDIPESVVDLANNDMHAFLNSRYKKKKMSKELALHESMSYMPDDENEDQDQEDEYYFMEESEPSPRDKTTTTTTTSAADNSQNLGATLLASKFAASTRKSAAQKAQTSEPSPASSGDLKMPKMFKPDMPDFS